MQSRHHIRIGLGALAAAALLALAGAVALASVTVYSVSFSKATQVKQMKKAGGGKKCKRSFVRKGKRRMRVAVARGPAHCRLRPPVQGDGPVSNHTFQVAGRIAKSGPKAARRSAYLSLRSRVGEGTGYTLRVFPRRGRFELRRSPGGAEFPVSGRDDAIKGLGGMNRLRLTTDGAEIRAFVNGTRVAAVTDSNPGAVTGTMLQFGVGHEAKTSKAVSAAFRMLRVAVPNP
ncbi:MAG TPA: hypothetical protein VK919_13485 [Solirubrobacterales bacterium]|nr:hypothetical protein [Solirubrobacterales bacterium]